MGQPIVIPSDVLINGMLSFGGNGALSLPTGSVGNTQIAALAGIDASKVIHFISKCLSQGSTATASAQSGVIHVAKGAGTIQAFRAGSVVANIGAAACTVDLKKNGSSILSSTIALNSSISAYATVAGTISHTTYVAGDVFEWVVTATAGGGTLALGLFAQLESFEAAQ